ncbi:hypothetical protein TYRP_023499 [Tyrophagus putrescentiae]|nr:hypothetical protein TYRP_023499 [Tyrophagus putrescentiae]
MTLMISFSHLPLPSPLVLLQCVDEGRLDEDVEGDADEERPKNHGKQVKRQRPAVGQRYQRPPSAQRHPDRPGVHQVEGVAGAGDGPEGGPGEERAQVAAVSGGTQPDGAVRPPLNVRVGAVRQKSQKIPREGDAKEEANEEDAVMIPRLVEKGDKGTGHAVFGEKVAAKCFLSILFRGNNVPRWKPPGEHLTTADHRTEENQQHRYQLAEFSILQVQQIELPVRLTSVHQGTDVGGPEGPIESGATAAAGPSNQAHAEQKEERQLRRQPGPAKSEEFKVAKSSVLTGGVLEGDDGVPNIHDLVRPLVDEPDLLGLNGLGHFVPLVLSFPTIPNLAMAQKIFANVFTVNPSKPQLLKAGVIWLIGTDGSGHNELASCVPSRRSMPINQMTSSLILFRHWSYSPRLVSVPEAIPAGGKRPQELNIFTAHLKSKNEDYHRMT